MLMKLQFLINDENDGHMKMHLKSLIIKGKGHSYFGEKISSIALFLL